MMHVRMKAACPCLCVWAAMTVWSWSLSPAAVLTVPGGDHQIPRGYVCPRAASAIQVDGRLDEASWSMAAWTADFTDIEGDIRPAPSCRTRVKMLWDETCLYIGAELQEPHVWATLRQRDTVIFYDNDFEVFIDPNGDNHEYYEFEMNALNTGWDLLLPRPYRDGGSAVDRWNIAGLKTAVHVRGTLNNPADIDSGWTVELAIPWSSLRTYAHVPTPPRKGDTWRINFSRVEWDVEIVNRWYRKIPGTPEHNWVWSPQGVIDMHQPEMWGYLQFAHQADEQYVPDPARRAREILMRIYHAEMNYRKNNNRWTVDLDSLGVSGSPQPPDLGPVVLEMTAEGFRASVELNVGGATTECWSVAQDSRLWKK
jgi:hypothetical protein